MILRAHRAVSNPSASLLLGYMESCAALVGCEIHDLVSFWSHLSPFAYRLLSTAYPELHPLAQLPNSEFAIELSEPPNPCHIRNHPVYAACAAARNSDFLVYSTIFTLTISRPTP